MQLCHEYLTELSKQFKNIEFHCFPHVKNQFANALDTLASMIETPEDVVVRPLVFEQRDEPSYCQAIEEMQNEDEDVWYENILKYLEEGTYPESASKTYKLTIRRMAMQYILCGKRLYKRSYDGLHLLCVTETETRKIIEEVHKGSYGPHMSGHMLSRKILRLGY